MISTLHIHLLGEFLVVSGDTPVTEVYPPRLQSLFVYLLLRRTAPQARARLAFLLWPDLTETQAHANLRKSLYHLRHLLPSTDQFLYAERGHLYWQPSCHDAPWTLDVQDMEQALASASRAELAHDTAVIWQALEQAVNLYSGDLLPDCYDEWILPERDRIRQLFLQAAEHLIVLLEQERDYERAIAVAQRLLRFDRLHEVTYRQLMRLYALVRENLRILPINRL
jgi:DNA-binding SARP family transcriptional activator